MHKIWTNCNYFNWNRYILSKFQMFQQKRHILRNLCLFNANCLNQISTKPFEVKYTHTLSYLQLFSLTLQNMSWLQLFQLKHSLSQLELFQLKLKEWANYRFFNWSMHNLNQLQPVQPDSFKTIVTKKKQYKPNAPFLKN